jgi:hypothetical protein
LIENNEFTCKDDRIKHDLVSMARSIYTIACYGFTPEAQLNKNERFIKIELENRNKPEKEQVPYHFSYSEPFTSPIDWKIFE